METILYVVGAILLCILIGILIKKLGKKNHLKIMKITLKGRMAGQENILND